MSKRDQRRFGKLANRTHKKNLPQYATPKGGRRL